MNVDNDGGGARIQAPFAPGNMGSRVHLVEKWPSMDGTMVQLGKAFPVNQRATYV